MIPQDVIDITQGAYFAFLGSRSATLTPSLHFVWGLAFQAPENVVSSFVVQNQYEHILRNYRENGRVALTYSDAFSHVAYQLKGRFLQARPLTTAERDIQQQYRAATIAAMQEMGYQAELVKQVISPADLALDIEVETIFDQTPGPNAGKEIAFQ